MSAADYIQKAIDTLKVEGYSPSGRVLHLIKLLEVCKWLAEFSIEIKTNEEK